MSVHIRYRFLKEKGDYLKDEHLSRGYTVVEANTVHPFHRVLKEFYKDQKRWSYTFQNFAFITRINELKKNKQTYQKK